MKPRPEGFLRPELIPHDSEQFDYIRELHEYLWRFVKTVKPGAIGYLRDYLDEAISMAESRLGQPVQTTTTPKEVNVVENVDIFNRRRCGNTTRQIDYAIQKLFEGRRVVARDHDQYPESWRMTNLDLFHRILKRLSFEHGLDGMVELKYININRRDLSIELTPNGLVALNSTH